MIAYAVLGFTAGPFISAVLLGLRRAGRALTHTIRRSSR